MEGQFPKAIEGAGRTISLQQVVTNLVDKSNTLAMNNHSSVLNEVGPGMIRLSACARAIPVMGNLLTTVVRNSRNGEIHITAEKYRDHIVFEIQERNNYNGYALAFSIGAFEPDAAVIGGHISIRGLQQKVTTISFSFPHH